MGRGLKFRIMTAFGRIMMFTALEWISLTLVYNGGLRGTYCLYFGHRDVVVQSTKCIMEKMLSD